ncbi:probable transcriptional regulator, marr family protein [Glaciecola punicea ACAM 611]|jgi:DNA-binding MarR family transcriptional regulator|uniref:Probable transcriptional regulator, marr family protein n=1 Tax=Glaciecola punicea ACAM 611 TaxID=1121923 RepID=H5TCL1_9ALTE|nr:MarR family transcriptional regulator [Glaciecola punicea]OFA32026.1 MarR family transcriptional regulator [Glaciecola punicea]GAB56038.1 probable transcriptional regulator, marr family protein [Glaciecola punicea ACAM 611]
MSDKNENTTKTSLLILERYLPYRLSILSNRTSSLVAQSYKDRFGLSITQWRIMAVLGEYPGASADEISAKTQIEKSLISRAISNLLNRNLIQRQISKEDKRRTKIDLTETGYDVYSQIVPLSLKYEEQILSCLSDDEQALLSELIDRLYVNAVKLQF